VPRAAPNDVMNVYTNDGFMGPNHLVEVLPCRLVPYDQITIETNYLSDADHYVTYIGGILPAGTFNPIAGGFQVDITTAWIIEFQSNPGVFAYVRWCERITPRIGGPYRRAHIAFL